MCARRAPECVASVADQAQAPPSPGLSPPVARWGEPGGPAQTPCPSVPSRVPAVTEEVAREALRSFVSSKCCYGSSAAGDLIIQELRQQTVCRVGEPLVGAGDSSLRVPLGGLGGVKWETAVCGAVLVSGGDTEGPSASSLVCSSREQCKK